MYYSLVSEKKPEAWATFRAEPELLRKLDKAAKDAERPRSWVIRRLLLRALAQTEKPA